MVLAACYGAAYPREARTPDDVDADGDGTPASVDCDDASPKTHPGATDYPGDGVDLDCDGLDDPPAVGPPAVGPPSVAPPSPVPASDVEP